MFLTDCIRHMCAYKLQIKLPNKGVAGDKSGAGISARRRGPGGYKRKRQDGPFMCTHAKTANTGV
jgi:hypothetical protein